MRKEYIVDSEGLNFNCQYMKEKDGKIYRNKKMCRKCTNEIKCKIYAEDINRRKDRVESIAKLKEIKEQEEITTEIYQPDREELTVYLGLSGLFDYNKEPEKEIETLSLNVEWVELRRRRSPNKKTKPISKKIREGLKSGNIPTLTLEKAKETLKERIKKAENIPTIRMEI